MKEKTIVKNKVIILSLLILTIVLNSYINIYAVSFNGSTDEISQANYKFKLDYLGFYDVVGLLPDDTISSLPIYGVLSVTDAKEQYLLENITNIELVTVRNNITISQSIYEPVDEDCLDKMFFLFFDLENIINNESYYITVTYIDENSNPQTEYLSYSDDMYISNINNNSLILKSSSESLSLLNINLPSGKNIGDINGDTYINSTDAAIALDIFKNNEASIIDTMLADVNKDNIVNSTDAAMILDIFKNNNN